MGIRTGVRVALLATLGCLIAIAVASCGGGGGSGSSSESSGSSKAISGTVEVWDYEYGSIPEYTKAVDKIDADFEALHPAVTVKRVSQPFEGYEAIYRAAFTAREGPDVMTFQPGVFGVLSFASGLEVLNPFISDDLNEQITQWASVTAGFTADGDHYGVPIGVNGFIVYYNKKLFAKAGLPTDFKPNTWAEVRKAGEKLEEAGIQPFSGGNKEGTENQYWFAMGWQTENTPEQTIELGEGTLPYTDPAVAKAFGPEFEMQEAGLNNADRFTVPWYPEGYVPFQEGKAGMTIGLWNVAGYWGEFNRELGEKNVGFFFPPGTSTVATLANVAYGMPKFASNKSAAWAFMEYTASKAGAQTLSEVGGYMPFRKDGTLPPDAPVQEKELFSALTASEPELAAFAVIPGAVAYGPMASEVNEALQGRTSLEEAQKAMQEIAEKSAPK